MGRRSRERNGAYASSSPASSVMSRAHRVASLRAIFRRLSAMIVELLLPHFHCRRRRQMRNFQNAGRRSSAGAAGSLLIVKMLAWARHR